MNKFNILLVFIMILFAASLSAVPANSIVKLIKHVPKTVKKVPVSVPVKPNTKGFSWNYVPDVSLRGCAVCYWTGKVKCSVCFGKGVVPGKIWGTNKCSSCQGAGKINHLCRR